MNVIALLLIDWYRRNRRRLPWRETIDPYGVWISEVMLQQTQVATVVPYYRRFMAAFPDVAALAAADPQKVLKHWEGLGYYTRARNLHKAARRIVAEHAGRFPERFEDVLALPGIGDYIASAVTSIAYGQPRAVVDGNVKRVLARLFAIEHPVNRSDAHPVFKQKATALMDRQDPATFNQALMELGALVCRPRLPLCSGCPVRDHCAALAGDAVSALPRRQAKAPTPRIAVAVGVVLKGDRVLIVQRSGERLLGGLWEFPGGRIAGGETEAAALRRHLWEKLGLCVRDVAPIARARHTYTHFRIDMAVFRCRFDGGRVRRSGPSGHAWVRLPALGRYPFHKASQKLFDAVHHAMGGDGSNKRG